MKIMFLAKAIAPVTYNISGTLINEIDTSVFPEGAIFHGNEDTIAAGIFDMFWHEGELHVVLAQLALTTDTPWAARDSGWIDAADYIPGERYVVATDPNALALIDEGKAEYALMEGKWTVRTIDSVKQEPAA